MTRAVAIGDPLRHCAPRSPVFSASANQPRRARPQRRGLLVRSGIAGRRCASGHADHGERGSCQWAWPLVADAVHRSAARRHRFLGV